MEIFIRVYHRTSLIPATIRKFDEKCLVISKVPILNLWSGNPVAFYANLCGLQNVVIGSGTIESPGLSIWEQKEKHLTPFRTQRKFWNSVLESNIYEIIKSDCPALDDVLNYRYRENISRIRRPYMPNDLIFERDVLSIKSIFSESRKWITKGLPSKTRKFFCKN